MRCAFAPISSPFGRADRVLTLVAMWLGSLTVSIWLQAERAISCCQSAADHVDCGLEAGAVPTPDAPCEFKEYAFCRDLMADPALGKDGDYFCNAFPIPGEFIHMVITVLMIFAGRLQPAAPRECIRLPELWPRTEGVVAMPWA